MADKETKNPTKTVFWADPDRTFGDGLVFGDEATGLIDAKRLEAWLDDGTLSEEKPESVAHASQSKLVILTAKVEELELENADLKTAAKKAPKPSKKAASEIAKLENDAVEAELKYDADIKYLSDMVQEMAKTWTDPKAGKQ